MKLENIYAKIKLQFYEKFKTDCLPILKRNDMERQKARIKVVALNIVTAIAVAIGIFLVILVFKSGARSIEGVLKLFTIIVLVLQICAYGIKKDFETKIKTKIMPIICKCFGDIKWHKNFYISKEETDFHYLCLVPYYNNEYFDDAFSGTFLNTKIKFYEASLWHKHGKSSSLSFKGLIIEFEMNKPFMSHTVITQDTLFHKSPSKKLKHTELEDVDFEKKYDVFTTDEVEARYLITPVFMEKIKNIQTAFKINKVNCVFFGKKMYLALSTNKDLFSVASLYRPLFDKEEFYTLTEQILSILKLVGYFKLQEKRMGGIRKITKLRDVNK